MYQKIILLATLILTSVSLIAEPCSINNKTNSNLTITVSYKQLNPGPDTCVKIMFYVGPEKQSIIDLAQRDCLPHSIFVKASNGNLDGKSGKYIASYPLPDPFTLTINEGPDNTLSIDIK